MEEEGEHAPCTPPGSTPEALQCTSQFPYMQNCDTDTLQVTAILADCLSKLFALNWLLYIYLLSLVVVSRLVA